MPTTAVAAAAAKPGKGHPPARRYPYSEAFFKNAIKDAVNESLWQPVSLGEKHNVRLKPDFETACWSYQPPHNIYIGTELFEKRIVKEGMSEELQAKYIANHYFHELGHALFTERDMKKIRAALKRIDAPFPLYNLFEDAYMEHRFRNEVDYRFEWYTMEDADFSPRPESLLFSLIQAEGDVTVVVDKLKDWKPAPPAGDDALAALGMLFAPNPEDTRALLVDKLPRVLDYYRKTIAATQSMHLMPLVNAWLEEFGRPPQMPKGGANGGMSDLEMSAELMTNPQAQANFEAECVPVSGETSDPETDPTKKHKTAGDAEPDCTEAVAKKGKVLHHQSTPVDEARAQRLAAKLEKFFEAKARRVNTTTPQRRVSAKNIALGRAPFRKTELVGRARKRVFLLIDCSGSMGGFHMAEGKVLLSALNILARKGRISGHVALSGVIDGPNWELFTLPMAQDVINRIQGYAGAEGLEYAMRDNLKLLQEADFAFVYTDADICDKPIDKSFFHRFGVFTWGLYAGMENKLNQLLKYFDKAILRETAEDLVDFMLVQNK